MAHGHQHDRAYDNVILHVVLDEDVVLYRTGGTRIPCLEMKDRIPPRLHARYEKLQHNARWIPCEAQFAHVTGHVLNLWLDRLLVERLEQKTGAIRKVLGELTGDWEETFYRFLARGFGLKVNVDAFDALAASLPRHILARHRDNLLQLEALLFGQAGMLNAPFQDDYPNRLREEFLFLRQKYHLQSMDPVQWKFLRMHPGNFPTVRLAQFARLLHRYPHLFSLILEVRNRAEIEALFSIRTDGYWQDHYLFDQPSSSRSKSFGKEALTLMTINTIVPFLFLYGAETSASRYRDTALELLESLPPERNAIIRRWEQLGVRADSSYRTQALLQLKNGYCDGKKCLECGVGKALLTMNDEL